MVHCDGLLACYCRIRFKEILNGLIPLQTVDEICKGTRVPTKTGVPPMISGSECTIPLRSSGFITAEIVPHELVSGVRGAEELHD